jgi:archaeosine synthase beta-subunit
MTLVLPESGSARDRWVISNRPDRNLLDPSEPYAFLVEPERAHDGQVVPVATVFLTNRQCPWRCVMCDLWRNTLADIVPPGAIAHQIDHALQRLPAARQIKLYNAGSFFDPGAIPPEDHAEIAEQIGAFERVIVESHPALVGDSCLRFRDRLSGQLEVAMGLETANPEALEKLNKRMTIAQFSLAARFLKDNQIALRAFLLVGTPFIPPEEDHFWVQQSIAFAFECGATVVSLIPTRGGNGAMDLLTGEGSFSPPTLAALESAQDYGIWRGSGRVFADLWDLKKFSRCDRCFEARKARLHAANLAQTVLPPVACRDCER